MAKIPFSKLGIKLNTDIASFSWGEYEVEVRQYLPMEEKAELITRVINLAADDNGYYNPLRVKVFLTLETTFAYTNLTFTAKMLKIFQMMNGSIYLIVFGILLLMFMNIKILPWVF